MKKLLAGGIACSLAWFASAAAQEQPWPNAAAPGIALGKPLPLSDTAPPAPSPLQPIAGIQLASYSTPTTRVVRAPNPEPARLVETEPVANGPINLTTPPRRLDSNFATWGTPAAPAAPPAPAAPRPAPTASVRPAPAASVRPAIQTVAVSVGAPIIAAAPAMAASSIWTGKITPMSGTEVFESTPSGETWDEGSIMEGGPGPGGGNRLYFSAEYLLWWIREPQSPVLVSTGSPGGKGFLGAPGTVAFFGGNSLNVQGTSGTRFTLGWWFDDCQEKGLEVSYFFLMPQATRFVGDPNLFAVLTRPFFDINNGTQSGEAVNFPGLARGGVFVNATSSLQGAEVNLRCNLCRGCSSKLDFLAGGRWVELQESLRITEAVRVLAPAGGLAPGDFGIVVDEFRTRNQFYGGQVGLDWEVNRNRWVFDFRGKLAAGVTHEEIDITGFQVITRASGRVDTFVGGLLALPSNIGHYDRSRFSVMPEVGMSVGYHVTDNLTVKVGYNFLFWSNVIRPGDTIDTNLDTNQIPNFPKTTAAKQVHPVVQFREQAFFVHGLTTGLEYKY